VRDCGVNTMQATDIVPRFAYQPATCGRPRPNCLMSKTAFIRPEVRNSLFSATAALFRPHDLHTDAHPSVSFLRHANALSKICTSTSNTCMRDTNFRPHIKTITKDTSSTFSSFDQTEVQFPPEMSGIPFTKPQPTKT
jgi:hypothetical protein